MPLRLRHEYAAGLPRGLPTGDINRPRSSPQQAADARRYPAIRQVAAGGQLLRDVHTLVHRRYTFLSCLPDPRPSDGAGLSRRCQGCLPPFPSCQGSGCPQLRPTAATVGRRCPFITARFESASWRSMSATHRSSGRLAEQSRFNRSRAGATSIFPRRHFFLERAPTRCAPRMIRATRLRPMQ